MKNQEVAQYIKAAREQGLSDQDIKSSLVGAGWSEKDIIGALVPRGASPVLVPPPAHPGMWVTFQYVLLFITLYVSAISLGGILYYWVDTLIPNGSSIYDYSFGSGVLQGYLSALIVAFPIFATLFVVLKKNLLKQPFIKGIRARQTLFYITLVIAFIIMMGQLISVVHGFLSGDITALALAHFGITLLIAGPIFWYLLREVRRDRGSE